MAAQFMNVAHPQSCPADSASAAFYGYLASIREAQQSFLFVKGNMSLSLLLTLTSGTLKVWHHFAYGLQLWFLLDTCQPGSCVSRTGNYFCPQKLTWPHPRVLLPASATGITNTLKMSPKVEKNPTLAGWWRQSKSSSSPAISCRKEIFVKEASLAYCLVFQSFALWPLVIKFKQHNFIPLKLNV